MNMVRYKARLPMPSTLSIRLYSLQTLVRVLPNSTSYAFHSEQLQHWAIDFVTHITANNLNSPSAFSWL